MNIAVFGWYHHQNAGDDRMQQCITRWLDGHCLAFLPAGRPPPLALLRTYDAVILGGGSIVNPDGGMFRNISRWVRKVGIPVAIVSVTIDEISPAFRAEFRRFLDLDLCCFAWFRDQESADLVGPHPKVFAAPDITWLFPFGGAEQTMDHRLRTTDRGPQTADHGPQTTDLPSTGVEGQPSEVEGLWSTVQGPSSQVQGPRSMVHGLCLSPFPVAICLRKQRGLPVERWSKVLAELAVQGHELLPWPLYFENGGDAEVLEEVLGNGSRVQGSGTSDEGRGSVVSGQCSMVNGPSKVQEHRPGTTVHCSPFTVHCSPCPTEFSPDPVHRAGAVISGRFHGILFALQMGRPVIAVSSLPKTRRFLEENGLEHWCVAEDAPERLLELWPQFKAEHAVLTEQVRNIHNRLQQEAMLQGCEAKSRLLPAAILRPRSPLRWFVARIRRLLS